MDIKTVAVIGAGTMGNGIAQVVAQAGYNVIMTDIKDEFLAKGMSTIGGSLDRLIKKGTLQETDKTAILGRIKTTIDLKEARNAQLVIESAPEILDLKASIFKDLESICPPETILASNTSYLSITEIASATQRPDQVVGMHFFNPVAMMKLVEVVKGAKTSENTCQVTIALARILQKEPVVCQDASYGFLANRAYLAMRMEAVQMVWERVAPPAEIDKALKLGYNLPVGPLELGDMGGSWAIYASSEGDRIHELGSEKGRLHPLVRLMIRAGYTGGAGKKGIYDFYKEVLSKW